MNWYRRESFDPIIQYGRGVTHADWTPLTIPNPCAATGPPRTASPARRAGSRCRRRLTIYNLNPEARGLTGTDWFMRNSSANSRRLHGFEAGFNARLAAGATIFGGWSMERAILNRCDQPEDPNKRLFCDASQYSIPFLHDFKIWGTVPLPGGIQLSGSAQFYPAQEMAIRGTDNFGGTNQAARRSTTCHAYIGNLNYNTTVDDFAGPGRDADPGAVDPLMPPGSLLPRG